METSETMWLLLALILPVSALLARGLPASKMLRMVTIWALIFGGVAVLVWLAQRGGWIGR